VRTVDGNDFQVGSPRTRGGPKGGWGDETIARALLGGEARELQDAAATAAQHAEGRTAMMMRAEAEAGRPMGPVWLDINNDYICWKCFDTLERLLPPDGRLIVRFQDGPKSALGWGPEIADRHGFTRAKNAAGLAWWERTFIGVDAGR
jgi:hypothetical protein